MESDRGKVGALARSDPRTSGDAQSQIGPSFAAGGRPYLQFDRSEMSDEEPEFPGVMINLGQLHHSMMEEQQRHAMSVDDTQHQIQSFFAEAGREELEAIQSLLRILVHCDSPQILAAHYDGVASTILQFKHNVCMACGTDHDEELARVTAESDTTNDDEAESDE